ncbi:hypothetical protein [Glycomyces harbinensis]|uniref:Peptidase inhibitor family I36 n=1 Tax=Glycomyces harbinensis TaxID=58114 RepID=A0A1G7BZT6_9ACTN|nr:hypothetical protein [Glycomyces harbinensis]SDE32614.1 hypothetical protein SAMN05216270_11871 [Glycomyces harbinensis]
MRKRILTMFAAMIAAFALMGAPAASADPAGTAGEFTAEAIASGLTADEAADLQGRVDDVLGGIPGGTQVSATEIRYDGLDVTVDPLLSGSDFSAAAIKCDSGWFCIDVRGTRFEFYTCKLWSLSSWSGGSAFNNNQSKGTVAKAYDEDKSTVWQHKAKGSGTVNVASWEYFRPC